MATWTTKSNRTFDDAKGGHRTLNDDSFWKNAATWFTGGLADFEASHKVNKSKLNSKYSGWDIPNHDMASLSDENLSKALDFYLENHDKLDQITLDNQLKEIMGGTNHADNKLAYLDYIIDKNAEKIGFDSTGDTSHYIKNEDGTYTYTKDAVTEEPDSGLDYYQELIDKNLMTDPNSERAQQYRQSMYSSINSYEQASQASLASAELDAYRMLGQQQLQLESEIANQRMQALKSGTTSAQLASQQLANMFAAQSAAQQTAAAVMQQRATMADQYNQQRASVESDLYNLTNNNALTAANAYAQLGAAQANYNSYIQQPYAQYKAALNTYLQNPNAYTKMMGLETK